jgi:hypothetical protein
LRCRVGTTKYGRGFPKEGKGERKGVGRFVNGFKKKNLKKRDDFEKLPEMKLM